MKKFVSKVLAGALGLSMLCGVAAAEGETYVSWYTFGDVYLSSVRTALDAAMEAKGLTVVDKDSNANQQTQTDDINTALVTGANAVVVNLVESGAIGTAETLMNAIKEKDVPAVFFNRAVSTDNAEAAELFKGYEKSAFIGTDFTQAGIMQGKMVGQYVLDHYDELDLNKDGKISYVMFKGDEANQEAIARTKYGVECADEVLTAAGKPALEYFDASNASKYQVDLGGAWSAQAALDYMNTNLSQYNEANSNMIELIICNNDNMAEGAISALEAAGYNTGAEGATTIPVFGVDATDAAKELIAAGKMTGTVKQDAEGMAVAIASVVKAAGEGTAMADAIAATAGTNAEMYSIADGIANKLFVAYAAYTK